MRIAVNARFLIENKLEGIGWYSFEVLKRIVENHPEDQFLFLFDRPYSTQFIFGKNVEARIVNPPARHPLLWYLWFEWSLPRIIEEWKADVFFSPDGYGSLSLNLPQYIVVHDLAYMHYPKQIPWMVYRFYKWFVPRYIHKAEHIFSVSNATKKDIVNQFGIHDEKISIAYNGCKEIFKPIDSERKQELRDAYSSGKAYFLFVGALHPRKNVKHLILGFDQFKIESNSDKKLLIVGRKAWHTSEIEDAYQHSKHKSDIHFLEYLNSDELSKITAAAFCAVCPSFLEGFGVPALEALNCDIPLIVSDRFSLPEVGGDAAIKINPDKPSSISAAMMSMEQNQDLNSLIIAGRNHRIKFNWDDTARHIYSVMNA